MRRETFIADNHLTTDDIAARFGADPRNRVHVIVRRNQKQDFMSLPSGNVAPGDEVVYYEFDASREDELLAVNAAFAKHYVTDHRPAWDDEDRVIREFVPPEGARVLEVCCGAGRVTGELLRGGNHVAALDASLSCVEHARTRTSSAITYVLGDALHLPFCDGAFDVGCVFENSLGMLFSKRTRVLEELVRVSKTRVIVGLREYGDDPTKVHAYFSTLGYLEVGQTFTMQSTLDLLDGLAPERRARIAHRWFRAGQQRPWGGREFFVVLELN